MRRAIMLVCELQYFATKNQKKTKGTIPSWNRNVNIVSVEIKKQ